VTGAPDNAAGDVPDAARFRWLVLAVFVLLMMVAFVAQRALIGRVAMDDPDQCPVYYRDASAAVAEADTRAFIAYVQSMVGNEDGLIRPVITPRFIPSCSDELLRRLGALARETGCYVQTHCSESDWEHGYVLNRCGVTDTAALESFGLLSRHTILAHGNFVGDEDIISPTPSSRCAACWTMAFTWASGRTSRAGRALPSSRTRGRR